MSTRFKNGKEGKDFIENYHLKFFDMLKIKILYFAVEPRGKSKY